MLYKFKAGRQTGVYYFLGNIHQHIIHALPLYRKIGGEFIVLSQKSYDFCLQRGVRVHMLDDRPDIFLEFDPEEIRATVDYLNQHAKMVVFYDVFSISKQLTAKQLMLSHGSSFKDYYIPWRIEIMSHYDAVAGLGPAWREKTLGVGVPDEKILRVGLARWDEIINGTGRVSARRQIERALDFDKGRKIVTYFPTWWGPTSIHSLGKDILRYLPDEYNMIFRPHPDTPTYVLGEYLNITSHKTNIRYVPENMYKDIDLMKIYLSSDLFIGDMSSVVIDALLTQKPVMFAFDKGDHGQDPKVYEPIEEIFDYSIKLNEGNVTQLPALVEEALQKGAPQELWRQSQSRIFYGLEGDTVEGLARYIKEQARNT